MPIFKIGHRGAAGLEPENTLRSFERAISFGVDAVEFDLHKCKTSELVVIHDPSVDRTTDGIGFVTNLTLEELKSLDAGAGEIISTFGEVLNFINRRVKVVIEIKEKEIAESIFSEIEVFKREKGWEDSDFIIISFYGDELARFHNLNPNIKTGFLVGDVSKNTFSLAHKFFVSFICPNFQLVNEGFILDARKEGFLVCVWTVDEPKDIERMKNLGAHAITSNFPERL